MKSYIKKKILESKHQKFFGIDLTIDDPLPSNFGMSKVFENQTLSKLFNHYVQAKWEIAGIHVGDYELLTVRAITALFVKEEQKLYLSNERDNENSLIEDIIHEFSHVIEDFVGDFLHQDGQLVKEFLRKRNQLMMALRGPFSLSSQQISMFSNPEFDINFDMFLFEDLGYDKITPYTRKIFIEPYAATSINEYWATGFEKYYQSLFRELQLSCPVLAEKLVAVEKLFQR